MGIHVILDILLVVSCLFMLPYVLSMLLTSLAAIVFLKKTRKNDTSCGQVKPFERRFLIAIPAHDEETEIAETVRSCRVVHYPASLFDVLVIADNCTDDTALRAAEAGARVLEHVDASQKSKGCAIEYMIDALKKSGEFDSLDALVIVDADSTVESNLLEQFALGLDRGSDWMQCYDCVGNADCSWRTRIMAYGFSLLNGVTLAGWKALGLSTSFRGNGMCMSTNGLRRIPWNARSLVEDLEYSWIVRVAGERIDFIENTRVCATMLSSGGTPLADQRRRWEFGRLAVCRNMLGPLVRSRNLSWPQKVAAILELTSQPTSHIALLYLILSVAAAALTPDMILRKQYVVMAIVCSSLAVATVALLVHGLSPFIVSLIPWRFASSLLYVPYYIIWRLHVLAKGRPQSWIRTHRESNSATNKMSSGEFVKAPAVEGDGRETARTLGVVEPCPDSLSKRSHASL
jgi:cellulose synthase/poly-beta-1,6-N-acetylglucosamine synthase-like glycosyltransferase